MKKNILIFLFFIVNLNLIACTNLKITTDHSSTISTESVAVINLNTSITINGNGVGLEGNKIYINKGGKFIFSGTLNNGYIEVNTKENVTIVLNKVTINNPLGPALHIRDAKKVILEIQETNILSDGESDNENDATIFTNDTLVIEGDGTLIITGNNNEGISSDDDIIINSGKLNITSSDDGLNAKDNITINGGYLFINANGDGIDSNGTININGGTIISLGSIKNGNGGIDATNSYTITGGTVIATGIKMTSPSINSTQASIYIPFETKVPGGTLLHIENNNLELLTFAPKVHYKAFYFSSNQINDGSLYKVFVGGSYNKDDIDGFYFGGAYSKSDTFINVTAAISPIGMDIPDGH